MPLNARAAYRDTALTTAPPGRVLTMLYDRLVRDLHDAIDAIADSQLSLANDALQLRQLANINPAVAGVRRSGSISVDMAWLASGRFDGLWEAGLAPWDVAPGLLMVKESGGFVSDSAAAFDLATARTGLKVIVEP